jgi:hypothetical protein
MILRGAFAIRHDKPAKPARGTGEGRPGEPLRRVTLYEVVKPGAPFVYQTVNYPGVGRITLRLGQLPGTAKSQRATRAWVLLTRGRRLELKLPDLYQEGDLVWLRGAEMANTLGYQLELAPPRGRR